MDNHIITYEDFTNIHLVAGTVKKAERLPNSNKLLRLQVSLGDEACPTGLPGRARPTSSPGRDRQIIAGLGLNYQPEDIIGKQVIVVENLAPKKLLGETSQGMLLAGSTEAGPVIISPESPLPDGTSIH
ncbi:MAG: methionine--tRNA ligase [Candidatus Paceibacterota bacterium]